MFFGAVSIAVPLGVIVLTKKAIYRDLTRYVGKGSRTQDIQPELRIKEDAISVSFVVVENSFFPFRTRNSRTRDCDSTTLSAACFLNEKGTNVFL